MMVVSHQHPYLRFPRKETFALVRSVLKGEARKGSSISVVFTNDHFMRRMNKRFLKHDRTTDVIAFPLTDGVGVDAEIYVNLDQARRQTRTYKVTFFEEVRRLLIHGTLHLAGYRDSTARGRLAMHRREDQYLERL